MKRGKRAGIVCTLLCLLVQAAGQAWAASSEWQTYLSDSFSESRTAFPSGQFDEAFYTVEDGEYVIDGSKTTQDSLSALTDNLYYYYAEAQCRVMQSSAGELAFSGLVFHYSKTLQKQRAYYVFYVYGDGYYGAKRVIGDDVVIVLPLARSREIDPQGPNTLAVDAQGTRFDLYINGKYVNGFTDVRIDGGGFGFYVSKQTVAAFDNFKVKVERRGGGREDDAPHTGGSSTSSAARDEAKYPRLSIPKDPSRPTYPWEVGVDKSTRARAERRERGSEPEIEADRMPQREPEADPAPAETEAWPDPSRLGQEHPASDPQGPEEEAAPKPDEHSQHSDASDPAGRPAVTNELAWQLPPDEELVISPPDTGSASDVPLLPASSESVAVRDTAAASPAASPESSAEFKVWETPRESSEPEPAIQDTSRPDRESGSSIQLSSPPAQSQPSASKPAELSKAEKDALFKAEKERKQQEKEARKTTERAEREKRETEERERREKEAAARQPNDENPPGADEPEPSNDYARIAASMRSESWDEIGTGQRVQYDLPERSAVNDETAPRTTPFVADEDLDGQGVQLPPLESAGDAPRVTADTAQPAAPAVHHFETQELRGGEPSAEDAALEARMPLILGQISDEAILLNPSESAAVVDDTIWTEAQPDSSAAQDSTVKSSRESVPLPAEFAAAQSGELKPSPNGPARGPVGNADSLASASGVVRIEDDFSRQRWPVSSTDGSRYRYADGSYEIDNIAASSMAISFQEERLGELQLDCLATYQSGADFVGFGIAGRFVNGPAGISYYGFFVSQSGDCLLLKVEAGQETVLADWTPSPLFRHERGNILRLECIGGQVRGLVNGELVLQARDNSLEPGGYALLAGPGVSVRFDDLKLSGKP